MRTILGLWTLFVFVSSPLHGILNTLGRQEVGLGFNIALLGTRVISIIVGVMAKDARIAIALFSITGVICYAAIALLDTQGLQCLCEENHRLAFRDDIFERDDPYSAVTGENVLVRVARAWLSWQV
jgi:hypothetical protein